MFAESFTAHHHNPKLRKHPRVVAQQQMLDVFRTRFQKTRGVTTNTVKRATLNKELKQVYKLLGIDEV